MAFKVLIRGNEIEPPAVRDYYPDEVYYCNHAHCLTPYKLRFFDFEPIDEDGFCPECTEREKNNEVLKLAMGAK